MKKIAEIISNAAKKQGVRAFIVGGAARDLILGKKIKDIDFLIEGSAIDFAKKSGFKIKSAHESFNTVKAEIEGVEVDIASTRAETYPAPGCLPVVAETGVSIEEDLKRRDFTVNSIAIDLFTGEYIDPYLGRQDIENKVLKVLHEKSFIDDPTRILRGLDFKYRFNFEFGENEKKLIKECAETFDNSALSIDRVYLTLNKIFSSAFSDKILKDIIENKIYKIWTNKLGIKTNEIAQLDEAISKFAPNSKAEIYLMSLNDCPYVKAPLKDNFEIYNFFKKMKLNQICFYYFKTKDKAALEYLKIKDTKLFVTGKTLLDSGFQQGEIIGQILNALLKEKILNPDKFKTIEDETNYIKQFKA